MNAADFKKLAILVLGFGKPHSRVPNPWERVDDLCCEGQDHDEPQEQFF